MVPDASRSRPTAAQRGLRAQRLPAILPPARSPPAAPVPTARRIGHRAQRPVVTAPRCLPSCPWLRWCGDCPFRADPSSTQRHSSAARPARRSRAMPPRPGDHRPSRHAASRGDARLGRRTSAEAHGLETAAGDLLAVEAIPRGRVRKHAGSAGEHDPRPGRMRTAGAGSRPDGRMQAMATSTRRHCPEPATRKRPGGAERRARACRRSSGAATGALTEDRGAHRHRCRRNSRRSPSGPARHLRSSDARHCVGGTGHSPRVGPRPPDHRPGGPAGAARDAPISRSGSTASGGDASRCPAFPMRDRATATAGRVPARPPSPARRLIGQRRPGNRSHPVTGNQRLLCLRDCRPGAARHHLPDISAPVTRIRRPAAGKAFDACR